MALTNEERTIIQMLETTGLPRYPQTVRFAFRGLSAFEMAYRTPSLRTWLESFSEAEIDQCFLLISIQSTISKAMLRIPEPLRQIRVRRLVGHFYSPRGPIHQSKRMSHPTSQKILQICETTPGNLLG